MTREWASVVAASTGGPLCAADLRAAIEAVREQPWEPHPCSLGHHIVTATGMRALRAGGSACCSACLLPLGPSA